MIKNNNTRDKVLEEVIIGYRNVVSQRYQYENLEKKYRLPLLDKRFRVRRTRSEAKMLERAKLAGVRVPDVLKVDDKARKSSVNNKN